MADIAWGWTASGAYWSSQASADSTCKSIRSSTLSSSAPDRNNLDDRTLHAFRAFPWTGGWSAVDFYDSLRATAPKDHRPHIVAIEYASPGYIELAVVVTVALNIRRIVDHVCSSIERANATYSKLYKAAMDRKLLKVDARRA